MILKICVSRSIAFQAARQAYRCSRNKSVPETFLVTRHFRQVTWMNDAAGSSRPQARDGEHQRVLPKTAARQGVTGHNVRYVLIISTVGAIVALTLAYYFVFY